VRSFEKHCATLRFIMARIARIVVPGLPHHVTQRGNRREPIFFAEKVRGQSTIIFDCDARNSVSARECRRTGPRSYSDPELKEWPWSSVRAHLSGIDDELVVVRPVLNRVADFAALLTSGGNDDANYAALRNAEGIGRPLGNDEFIAGLERILGRPIARRAPGRKPRLNTNDLPKLL
jgi:ribosomal protein L40E